MNKVIAFFPLALLSFNVLAQRGETLTTEVKYNHNIELPYKVDNGQSDFFRPIHDQGRDGSCAQASGLAYTFTYEVNSRKEVTSKKIENQFPAYYTWNYLNEGRGVGTFTADGWEIAKTGGVPLAIYTDSSITSEVNGKWNHKKWYSGYNIYYNAMQNRVDWYGGLAINTPEKLKLVKRWFYDRGTGAKHGGLVNFSAGNDKKMETLAKESEDAGKKIITEWKSYSQHAMTFVGYNDSVKIDFNKDGKFTNNKDINDDGIVDMSDWEIGAMIVANTYGLDWGNDGYCYMMYRLLAADQGTEGGITNQRVKVMMPKENYTPRLTFKATIKHTSRYRMKLSAGISTVDKDAPDHEYIYRQFRNMGGDLPLSGDENDELEIGLDVSELIKYTKPGEEYKFYFIMESDGGKGEVVSCSLIDYEGKTIKSETSFVDKFVFEDGEQGKKMISQVYKLDYSPVAVNPLPGLPKAKVGNDYSFDFSASNESKLSWETAFDYSATEINKKFPEKYMHSYELASSDDGFAYQELKFDFPAYGRSFGKVTVSTNGYLIFEDEKPEQFKPNVRINAFDADLALNKQGRKLQYYGNEHFAVFRWREGFSYNKKKVDVAVKLYKTGEIEYYYRNISDSSYFTSGISDGIGNSYVDKYTRTNSLPKIYSYKLEPQKYPTGLLLSRKGRMEGVPQEGTKGNYTLKLRVRDMAGNYATKHVNVEVE